MRVSLRQFLHRAALEIALSKDFMIDGLAMDSRLVKRGDLFFAIAGCHHDATTFIDQAIHRGVAAIMIEAEESRSDVHGEVAMIYVKDFKKHLGKMIAQFYALQEGAEKTYLEKMQFIGVTGTNGKTSCTQLLTQALNLLGVETSMVGTIGYGKPGHLTPLQLTTPDTFTLQNIFHEFSLQKVSSVVMEASSHALDQHRTSSIPFSLGIFTNLSHDHLDYHHTMENYAKAKRRLFELDSMTMAVFNVDDPVGLQWMHEFSSTLTACGYSQTAQQASIFPSLVFAKHIQLNTDGLNVLIQSPWGEGRLRSRLVGQFNVMNLLAVIAALGLMNFTLKEILNVVPELTPPPGRLQLLGGGDDPLVVIDFAHTPDALQKALETLKQHCHGKLIVIFGCGGDRDATKRPIMGRIAESLADEVILTNDNVRHEDPLTIIHDILAGCHCVKSIQVIPDRVKAINIGIQNASSKDVILLAGKGHEQYQIIGDMRLPFDEVAIVQEALSRRK